LLENRSTLTRETVKKEFGISLTEGVAEQVEDCGTESLKELQKQK
jgi:hypothetical protein